MADIEVKGYQVHQVAIKVSERDILEKAYNLLESKLKIDGFLRGDEIRVNDEYYHGSWGDSLVRKATPEDVRNHEFLGFFKELMRTS